MQLTDGVKYINPKLLMTNDSYNDPTFTSTHGHNDRVGLSTVVSPRLAAGRRPAAGGMPPWPWPAAYIHIAISNFNAWQCGDGVHRQPGYCDGMEILSVTKSTVMNRYR